jgi:hypothetical protein
MTKAKTVKTVRKPRRKRIDSTEAAVEIMLDAAKGPLQPPAHVSVPDGAMPFWDAIIRARPRSDWEATPALMNAAANLAWTQYRIDQVRRMVDGEIPLQEGRVISQLSSDLLKMQRLEMGYLRVLQQSGRATLGAPEDVARRQSLAEGVKKDSPLEEDDLLATPNMRLVA